MQPSLFTIFGTLQIFFSWSVGVHVVLVCILIILSLSLFQFTDLFIDWLQSLKHFFINVSYHTCSQSNSDGSVLKQSHQS